MKNSVIMNLVQMRQRVEDYASRSKVAKRVLKYYKEIGDSTYLNDAPYFFSCKK